jgi:hypothetical protein
MGKFALFVGFIFTSPMVQPNIDILGGFILSHHHEPIHSIISSMIKFLRTYIGSHNFNSYIYILLQLVFIHFFGIMQVNKSSPKVLSQNYSIILLYTRVRYFGSITVAYWSNERHQLADFRRLNREKCDILSLHFGGRTKKILLDLL